MLATTERPSYQLPKIEGNLKPKTIILGCSLVLGLLFYSQSIKQPKVVELSTNKQSQNYTEFVESLADNYLLIAEEKISTPGNSCFRLPIYDCLEQLKPDKPKQLQSLAPEKAINSDLRQLGYQVRIDAINFAQERIKGLHSSSRRIERNIITQFDNFHFGKDDYVTLVNEVRDNG
jgi:hypothetical protein